MDKRDTLLDGIKHLEQIKDSRSKFIEIKCMPKELQVLKDKKGNPKVAKK